MRGAIFLRGNYPRGQLPGSNYPGDNFPWGQLSLGTIIQGAIVQGAIFLEGNCPRTLLKILTDIIVQLNAGFPFLLFHPFLGTMLLSKSLISSIFLKPDIFWFQKMMEKIQIDVRRKNAQNYKTIINTIYMKTIKTIIRKL